MKTTHPRAMEVANEIGVRAGPCNAEGTEWSLDCSQADFDEILAELEAVGPSTFNAAQVALRNSIQSECYGRDFV